MIAWNNLEILISIKTKALKILQIKWNIYSMQETSLFLGDSDCSVFLPAARDSVCWKKREFQIITVLWCKILIFCSTLRLLELKKRNQKERGLLFETWRLSVVSQSILEFDTNLCIFGKTSTVFLELSWACTGVFSRVRVRARSSSSSILISQK